MKDLKILSEWPCLFKPPKRHLKMCNSGSALELVLPGFPGTRCWVQWLRGSAQNIWVKGHSPAGAWILALGCLATTSAATRHFWKQDLEMEAHLIINKEQQETADAEIVSENKLLEEFGLKKSPKPKCRLFISLLRRCLPCWVPPAVCLSHN